MFYCYKVKWWNDCRLHESEGLVCADSPHEVMCFLDDYYGADNIIDCRVAWINSDFNVDDNRILPFEEFDVNFDTFIKS